MLPPASTYAELRSRFRWDIPEFYNIGVDVCDRWAAEEPDRLALIDAGAEGDRRCSFGQLRDLSNQTANLLAAQGIGRGDQRRELCRKAREETGAAVKPEGEL